MARGTTLIELLSQLRAEAGLSRNPAHNTQDRDAQVNLLQREQERLWEEFDWPHLMVERVLPISVGEQYYDPPDDLSIDRILAMQFKSDGEWFSVRSGIGAAEYAAHDSFLDARAWPVSAWRVVEDQIEIWPIPDQAADATTESGYLKFLGIRNLNPLIADSDRADLDDRMLTLYAAGSILAAAGSKDAQLKIEAANRRFGKLKGVQQKTRGFRMFSLDMDACTPRRPVITRYRPPVT